MTSESPPSPSDRPLARSGLNKLGNAFGKAAGMAGWLGKKAVGTARTAVDAVAPALESAEKKGAAAVKDAGHAVRPLVDSVGKAGKAAARRTTAMAKPVIDHTQKTASSIAATVDPVAVGGAVAGMTTGEIAGAAIGGALGAIAGPGGAILGAELGAFAGLSVGVKLGYDVTHEVIHPEEANPNATLRDRVDAVTRSVSAKAGDAVGGGVGAAGGAMVGTIVAGPVGAVVGSFVGEAVAARVGQDHVEKLYGPAAPTGAQDPTATQRTSTTEWLREVAHDTVTETTAATAFGAIGGLVAGSLGKKLGQRAGLVVVKHARQPGPTASTVIDTAAVEPAQPPAPADSQSGQSPEKTSVAGPVI
jgi:outer membrane lipoprotein SlyB